MLKRHHNLAMVFASLVLVFCVVGVAAQDDTARVNMIVTRDPISFDPHGTLDPGAPVLLNYVYDTLVFQDKDGSIIPNLAESWTVSEDGLSITFNLRDDVVFSDGSPMNADAVIYTFERLLERGQRLFIYGDVSKIESFDKVGDYTVTFNFSEPTASLLSAMTFPYAGILSPEATEARGEDYGMNPVGTGPFMLASWTPETSLTLVPNPNYNGHRSWVETEAPLEIDELVVRFTADQSARANALLAGEADIAYMTSAPQLARFEDNDDFSILDSPGRSVVYAGFNTGRAPFDNPDVRRALAQAVNKEDVLLISSEGLGEVMDTPLAPTLFGYDEALGEDAVDYDPEAAREALAEAGYGEDNPLSFSILTSTFPTFQVASTVLQAQFEEIGVDASIEVLDYSAVRELATNGDYDMLVTRYDWMDPDVLRLYLASENIGSTNRFFYDNPALDALLAEGRATYDPEARAAIYADAQRIVIEEMPWIPLFMPITKVVINNRVQNVDLIHSHIVLDDAVVVE